MGRNSSWFNAVKKALHRDTKEKKGLKLGKPKRKWFGKKRIPNPSISYLESVLPSSPSPVLSQEETILPTITLSEGANLAVVENEQAKNAYSVAIAATKAAEAAVVAAQAAAEVARLAAASNLSNGKSKEELAALKIQTAFRKYLAKRALLALKGLARLKTLMQAQSVKQQTTSTIQAMQTLVRIQSQIRFRRLKMAEENLARQRRMLLKHTNDVGTSSKIADDWDDSVKTREQIEAHLHYRHEAAVRRERAMAYAFNHQQTWRKPATSLTNTMFLDQNNPYWGWSWLERWLAAKPWETVTMPEKELTVDLKSRKPVPIAKAGIKSQPGIQHHKPAGPAARLSTSSTPSKTGSPKSVPRKLKSPIGGSPRASMWGMDDDSRSVTSMRSDQGRRHSLTGSSIRDDESQASSPAAPSYMTPTASTRAKSRLANPLNMNKGATRTPDRASVSSAAKTRLSYPNSPARSRHSASSITEAY